MRTSPPPKPCVASGRKRAASYIQRKLSVGYNTAATLVGLMEDAGVVSTANHVGKREVLRQSADRPCFEQ